jgi:hypothetical protein
MAKKVTVSDPALQATPLSEPAIVVSTDPLGGSAQVSDAGKETQPAGEPDPTPPAGEEPGTGPVESTPRPAADDATPSQRSFLDEAMGGFDPLIHKTGEDGKPVINKDGTFARKPGRRPGAQAASKAPDSGTGPQAQPLPQGAGAAIPGGSKEMAVVIARTFTAVLTRAVGDEWSPTSVAEMRHLEEATEKYLVSIGGVQLSPAANMIIAYGAYGLARMGHENTRTKTSRVIGWVKSKLAGLFYVFKR